LLVSVQLFVPFFSAWKYKQRVIVWADHENKFM